MEQVTFVILHYLALDATRKCVESILKMIHYDNYKIIIVDNASPNHSGLLIQKQYQDNPRVKVILADKNSGFSAGNNIGYRYAKEKYKSDYIIVMNNDTEIIQKDFVDRAISIYKETDYYVLGPDIISSEGIHQSPQRNHIITKKETRIWYCKRILFSVYLHLHRGLKLPDNFVIYRIYQKHDAKRIQGFDYDERSENVELQGACFLFSPSFVYSNETAFEELTFMYGEEALLAVRCWRNRWKIIYDPSIKITHLEQAATKQVNKNLIDKEIFYSDHCVKAIGAVLRNIKVYGEPR